MHRLTDILDLIMYHEHSGMRDFFRDCFCVVFFFFNGFSVVATLLSFLVTVLSIRFISDNRCP